MECNYAGDLSLIFEMGLELDWRDISDIGFGL